MPAALETALRLGALVLGAYLAALWLSLTVWAYRDMASRTRDLLLRLIIPLLVLLFNVLGLPLYLMLRPPLTLAEQYERSLEEEALLREVEEELACPTCKGPVAEDYVVCPACRTRLREPCPRCQRPLQRAWVICPYCAYYPTEAITPARSRESGA